MNISNNISSIQAHQTMMNTNANNIANVNTDGFSPSDTKISNSGDSIVANNRKSSNSSFLKNQNEEKTLENKSSETNLTKEISDQVIIEKAIAANVTAIKTQDEMLGSLLDIKI